MKLCEALAIARAMDAGLEPRSVRRAEAGEVIEAFERAPELRRRAQATPEEFGREGAFHSFARRELPGLTELMGWDEDGALEDGALEDRAPHDGSPAVVDRLRARLPAGLRGLLEKAERGTARPLAKLRVQRERLGERAAERLPTLGLVYRDVALELQTDTGEWVPFSSRELDGPSSRELVTFLSKAIWTQYLVSPLGGLALGSTALAAFLGAALSLAGGDRTYARELGKIGLALIALTPIELVPGVSWGGMAVGIAVKEASRSALEQARGA